MDITPHDPVPFFKEIRIPQLISTLISDFVFGWKTCKRCGVTYDDSYFIGRSFTFPDGPFTTTNCWKCRQRNKQSLRARWVLMLCRKETQGYIRSLHYLNTRTLFEWAPDIIIFHYPTSLGYSEVKKYWYNDASYGITQRQMSLGAYAIMLHDFVQTIGMPPNELLKTIKPYSINDMQLVQIENQARFERLVYGVLGEAAKRTTWE